MGSSRGQVSQVVSLHPAHLSLGQPGLGEALYFTVFFPVQSVECAKCLSEELQSTQGGCKEGTSVQIMALEL